VTTEDRLRDFILRDLRWRGSRRQLTDDRPLIEQRILDSLGIYELVAFLEADLGVDVADDELIPENFATIGTIARFVARKRAGRLSA
jgi:acyl carrier protein